MIEKSLICQVCSRSFKSIYSLSAHKGHCVGLSSTKQFDGKRGWAKGKIFFEEKEIFCENSRFKTGYAKKVLISLAIRPWECENCSLSEWLGKKIVLELHHKNGDNRDHSLKNIQLLCPNCHSQTHNWRGRGINGKKKVSDEELLEALKLKKTISEALEFVKLTPAGKNYDRCKKILQKEEKRKRNLEQKKIKISHQIEKINELDKSKRGWVSEASRILGVSHTQIRRLVKKYL